MSITCFRLLYKTFEVIPCTDAFEISGKIKTWIFLHFCSTAFAENFCHKLRTEVAELLLVGDAEHTESNTGACVAESALCVNKGFKHFLYPFVNLRANFNSVKLAGKRVSSGLEISCDFFDNKTLVYETVKGVHVFFKTDGSVSLVAPRKIANELWTAITETGQQYIYAFCLSVFLWSGFFCNSHHIQPFVCGVCVSLGLYPEIHKKLLPKVK